MDSVFTENEIKIYKLGLLGKNNKEIAKKLEFSPSYVSQTFKTINEKINKLKNSYDMLIDMGITEFPSLQLSEKGKAFSAPETKLENKIKLKTSVRKPTKAPLNEFAFELGYGDSMLGDNWSSHIISNWGHLVDNVFPNKRIEDTYWAIFNENLIFKFRDFAAQAIAPTTINQGSCIIEYAMPTNMEKAKMEAGMLCR